TAVGLSVRMPTERATGAGGIRAFRLRSPGMPAGRWAAERWAAGRWAAERWAAERWASERWAAERVGARRLPQPHTGLYAIDDALHRCSVLRRKVHGTCGKVDAHLRQTGCPLHRRLNLGSADGAIEPLEDVPPLCSLGDRSRVFAFGSILDIGRA